MVKNDGSMAIRSAKDACDELGVEEHKVSNTKWFWRMLTYLHSA